jgi:hypothetical protein
MHEERPLYRTRPRNRLSGEMLELIWAMYWEGGQPIASIAAEVGRSYGTISIYLRELRAAKGGIEYLNAIGDKEGIPRVLSAKRGHPRMRKQQLRSVS